MYIRVFWMHQRHFDKLLKRGVGPTTVCSQNINRLVHYTHTTYVRWNSVISSDVGVSNRVGLRQGGIFSPYIFCVYMGDLSIRLNDIKVDCTIGATLITCADYLVLLSSSAMGLSLLLSVCSAYGIEHGIQYNSAKRIVMSFCCNKMKDIRIPNFV